jgi:S-(hydroxymethyl)glutathione dehydrogenase/alcohol dehydrogenase
MQFQAAVLTEVNRPLSIETVSLEKLAPFDVLVRNRASGLCHSDLEVIAGALPYPLPIVLGHEAAGIVADVGSMVTHVAPGDHVVASWNPHCGHCFYCERDLPILCEHYTAHQPAGRLLDGKTRLRWRGAELHHFSAVAGHAEYFVVPESGAVAIPRELPFDRACLLGCAVMTGFGAVCRLARVEPGSSLVVVGCGAVGLNAIQAGRFSQCEHVIAIDRDPVKLAAASRLGASMVIADLDQALDRVKAISGGRGADYVFEAAGTQMTMQAALELARPGGQVVILGKVDANTNVSLRFGSMLGEKRITRSSYGGARPRRDFPWLARLYLQGELKLDELISSHLTLDTINTGFERMRSGEGVRHVVMFDT